MSLDWIRIILAVAAGAWATITTIALYGFSTGKFIQKRHDDVEDLRRRVGALADRATQLEKDVKDEERARMLVADRVQANVFALELLKTRMDRDEKHADERRERVDERLCRLEDHVSDLERRTEQRQRPR